MQKNYETQRLFLKILDKDSASMVLPFYEDNRDFFEPWEPERSPNFYSLSYQKASLSAEYNLIAEGKLLRYWVFLKDNPGEIIGCVCLQNILREPYCSCTLGYKISRKYLHMGYAFESIQKCIDVMFHEKQIHRIEAYIMPSNLPSLCLINRFPFYYEGISYSYARIRGQWTDHHRYSMINPLHQT